MSSAYLTPFYALETYLILSAGGHLPNCLSYFLVFDDYPVFLSLRIPQGSVCISISLSLCNVPGCSSNTMTFNLYADCTSLPYKFLHPSNSFHIPNLADKHFFMDASSAPQTHYVEKYICRPSLKHPSPLTFSSSIDNIVKSY